MAKKARIKYPYELYDVAGLEEWFARMAAQGLHLAECRGDYALFTPGEPMAQARFRLEAQGTYERDLNKNEEYSQMGWEHISTIRGLFYVFRCDNPTAAELHTDPEIQSWTMKKLIRRQWFWFLYWPVYWAFMMQEDLLKPHEGIMQMIRVDAALFGYLLMVFVLAYLTSCQLVQFNALRRLKKRLASGLPMDRSRRYPWSFWRHGFLWVLLCAALAVVPATVMLRDREPEGRVEDYPYVTLEDLIPGQYIYPTEGLGFRTGEDLDTSLLAPVQVEFGDAAVLDNGGWDRVRVNGHYYETVSPAAAELLLRCHMAGLEEELKTDRKQHEKNPDFYSQVTLDTGAVPTRHGKLDRLWVYDYQYERSERNRAYFGCMGSKALVLYVILPQPEMALERMVEEMEVAA